MGILDQVFNESDVSAEFNEPEWVVTGAAVSAHQAMQDGFDPVEGYTPKLERPEFGTDTTVNILKSVQLSETYREVLFQNQTRDIRDTNTSDFVVDSGMKKGSKVIISIVPEDDGHSGSWDGHMRAKSTGSGLVFPHFSVQSISEPNEERYQLHETIGADFIQSFGRRPRIFMISGIVMNGKVHVNRGMETISMDWKNAFQRWYKDRLSLSKCVRNRKKIRIFAQHTVWDGYIVNLVSQTSAQNQGASQITVSFVLDKESHTEQNDENIPGFVTEDGFTTPGLVSPDEMFPTASLRDYLGENLESSIQERLDEKYDKERTLWDLYLKHISHETLDTIDENIRNGAGQGFFRHSSGKMMHNVLRGTDFAETFMTQKDIDDKEERYLELMSEDPSGNFDEGQRLQQEIAEARNLTHGQDNLVDKVNKLSIEYSQLKDDMNRLEEIL